MRIRHQIAATLALAIVGSAAEAQISKETLNCQKYIAKAVEKFSDSVADRITKCLLAVQQCNTNDTVGEVNACVDNLLVLGQGRCAVGKLSSDSFYYGNGSAAANNPDDGLINRDFEKYKKLIAKCDLIGTNFADLNLPVPASHDELADLFNDGDETGAACLGHRRIRASFSDYADLLSQLAGSVNVANVPVPLSQVVNVFNPCR